MLKLLLIWITCIFNNCYTNVVNIECQSFPDEYNELIQMLESIISSVPAREWYLWFLIYWNFCKLFCHICVDKLYWAEGGGKLKMCLITLVKYNNHKTAVGELRKFAPRDTVLLWCLWYLDMLITLVSLDSCF